MDDPPLGKFRQFLAVTLLGTAILVGVFSPRMPGEHMSWPAYVALMALCTVAFQGCVLLVGVFGRQRRLRPLFMLLAVLFALAPGIGIVALFKVVWNL
jgi:hypothetical protein